MSTRRTGLGLGSLLLRRTTEQEASPTPEPQPEIEQPEAERYESPVFLPKRPLNDRGVISNRQLRDRCTVYLDPAVNQQLDIVARIEGRQRSEVVTDLLRRYLPKYRIDRG